MRSAGKTGLWILKPSLGDKAAGIIILNNLKKLKETVMKDKDLVRSTGISRDTSDVIRIQGRVLMIFILGPGEQVEWVLQKYVEKPLLVNKKKFHLRVHVLAVGRYRAVSFARVCHAV